MVLTIKRKKKSIWKSIKTEFRFCTRARFSKPISPYQWLFIVGCYNSGTTLLNAILGSHPKIKLLRREGVELTDALPRPEQYGWPRMWHKCYDAMLIDEPNAVATAERIKRHWAKDVSGSIEDSFLVEKSIANIPRLEFLHAHFKPAKFIYIVRNGYAVAEGIRRRVDPRIWGREEFGATYPISLCAEQWVASDRAFKSKRELIGDVLEISYEELTEEVSSTLDKVANFLSVDAFPNEVLDTKWLIHRKESAIQNMNSASISRLSAADKKIVANIAGDVLSEYGYSPE